MRGTLERSLTRTAVPLALALVATLALVPKPGLALSVTVEPPVIVAADSKLHGDVSIAVNPNDPKNMVIADRQGVAPNTRCGFHTTFDGGKTWSNGLIAETVAFPGQGQQNPCTLGSSNAGSTGNNGRQPVPRVAFDGENRVFYAAGMGVRTAVAVSRNGGATFGALVPIGFGRQGPSLEISLPSIAVDPANGHAYVFFEGGAAAYGFQGIWSSRSTDHGSTWSIPTLAGDRQLALFGWGAALPAIQRDGTVRMQHTFESPTAFSPEPSLTGIVYQMMLATSTDGGVTYDHPNQFIRNAGGHNARTWLAADPTHNGALYLVWGEWTGGHEGAGSDIDIYFSRTRDGGATWSAPVLLNDDGLTTPFGIQESPVISVAPNGRIDVAWYDLRNNPPGAVQTNQDAMHDVYYTYSTDGGDSWASNIRVTPSSFRLGGHFAREEGIGIVSLDDGAAIAFQRKPGATSAQDVLCTRIWTL